MGRIRSILQLSKYRTNRDELKFKGYGQFDVHLKYDLCRKGGRKSICTIQLLRKMSSQGVCLETGCGLKDVLCLSKLYG